MAINLIFDGNYLFYKTLFIFGGYAKDGKILEEKGDQGVFMRKVATDFSHAVRTFGNPDRIIFTIDSRSWRKEIEIEDGAYKGHREEKPSTIDWDAFYRCMNEFGEILSKKGIIVSKEERAEGDDLMFLWAEHLFRKGLDSVIITGDGDMSQNVRFNGKNFVIVYNPNSKSRKLIAPFGFKKWIENSDEVDIFDASTYMNRSKDLIVEAAASIPIVEIDPKYVIFEKVITGDAGDAVPPIWTWKQKNKNGEDKTYRVTATKAQRMYEILNQVKPVTDVFDLPNRAVEVTSTIAATCKQNAPSTVIKSRLERNLQLVFLDERILPKDIQDNFRTAFESGWEKKELGARTYDMNNILGGTQFVLAGRHFESDIFSKFSTEESFVKSEDKKKTEEQDFLKGLF